MNCLEEIKTALLSVTECVFHFTAHKAEPPYIVWAEDGAGDTLFANGRLQAQVITGTVDLFALTPEDTALFQAIQAALDGVCAWRLNSIQYEDDTGMTHYEWTWKAVEHGKVEDQS